MTYLSQRGAEIHGRSGFAHAAFLISDRNDLHKERGTAVPAVGPTGILPIGLTGETPALPTDRMSVLLRQMMLSVAANGN